MKAYLTRAVILLACVSLLADVASEMLYPVMPLYWAQAGMGVAFLGVLEGVAGFVAAMAKAWLGAWSDHTDRRLPFVRMGYLLGGLAKPLQGLWLLPGIILSARMMDRLGKGMRGGARDAILIEEAGPEHRGRVFGFHRSMDTLGAVLGPLLGLLWLWYHPGDYRSLFLLAVIPGLLAALLTLAVRREKEGLHPKPGRPQPFRGILQFWKNAPRPARTLILAAAAFSLLSSSDMFLLVRAGAAGLTELDLILAYLLFNLTYALAAWPLGMLGDKIGFRPIFLGSVALYGLCYLGFGFVQNHALLYGVFGLYGVFMAGNEGVMKAWLSLYIPKDQKATGMGFYQFINMLALLIASPLMGLLWAAGSPEMAFVCTGAGALLLCAGLAWVLPASKTEG